MRSVPSRPPTSGWDADMHRDHFGERHLWLIQLYMSILDKYLSSVDGLTEN